MWDKSFSKDDGLFRPAPTATVRGMSPGARAFLPVAAWCALIFGLSSIPGSSIPEVGVWQFDKVVHAGIYGVLGALAARAFARATSWSWARVLVLGALFATAYGVTDELHQRWTPYRSSDPRDVAADAVGALAGAALATSILRRGKSRAAL
jgi:VanZ family protein